ncbi:MAG TPA: phospho-sugar mutase [Motilibacteraceae bacterium]|nr:phospho-sugar mutase [Motilibacteraceae bacterium]
MSEELVARAQEWLADDPDPATRAELQAILDAGDVEELRRRFAGRLEFGTAGLRGPLGAGPTRMNRVVVQQAAAGLCAYLRERDGGAVVVGYDARHNSDVFAHDTAAVATGAGLSAMVLPHPLPTPVLAFAIRHLGAAAGVMVTASHNPPQDNGYKVYLGDGMQIVPPADAEISAHIDAVGQISLLPKGEEWETLDDEVLEDYLDAVATVVAPGGPRALRVIYTPMHGVGRDVLVEAMTRAGFALPEVVPAQAEPDPEFPTVAFPNPEEPGAIDLALKTAREAAADLVIANDPDADRCAVAVPDPDVEGGWRMLRGDEVGALLGEHLAARGVDEDAVFANSIVSSSLLGRIAAAHGIAHTETLTGFKWIARVENLRYGYEEALGYCVAPELVRDKDGISAALVVLELAAALKAEGRTLLDALDDLARTYGLHATEQLSVRVEDLSLIAGAMARLRAQPPTSLGGLAVQRVDDLERGDGGLPPTDGLRFVLADDARVVVRPSGTEPKLKCYLEVVVPVGPAGGPGGTGGSAGDVRAARAVTRERLDAVKRDLGEVLGL